jgi:dTDP-4-amino-4,6-dideoxygalactose transaminase
MTSGAIDTAPVPFMDLLAMHREIVDEVDRGFAEVLASGGFVAGPKVTAFEQAFAAYSGRQHCVGTANGTDALEMALRAGGLRAGDEVIIPANTFVATAEAIMRIGARTVCVDVDADTLLLDPAAFEAAITDRTKAVVPVHLFGQMAPMAPIQRIALDHGLVVIEDAAQSQGATQDGNGVGAGSLAAATSFYPGKNLGAYGDAGAVLADDSVLAARVRRIGNHGSEQKYVHEEFGFNSRLDALQAVVLSAKLNRLNGWNDLRQAAAERYHRLLDASAVVTPVTAAGNVHVWHLYVVRVPDRDAVITALQADGINVGIHYPIPVHRQPAFADSCPAGAPITEQAAGELISIPLFPGITADQQERVAESLLRAVE